MDRALEIKYVSEFPRLEVAPVSSDYTVQGSLIWWPFETHRENSDGFGPNIVSA